MFRCALLEFEALDITIAITGSSHIAQLPIGYDEETELRYSILAALDMFPGYGPERKELVFCVLEANLKTGVIDEIWDGRIARGVLTETAYREAVMSALEQMVQALVDEAKPRVVVMVTQAAGLPEKALTKYYRIAATLGALGFQAGKADIWHGRHTWMMERR